MNYFKTLKSAIELDLWMQHGLSNSIVSPIQSLDFAEKSSCYFWDEWQLVLKLLPCKNCGNLPSVRSYDPDLEKEKEIWCMTDDCNFVGVKCDPQTGYEEMAIIWNGRNYKDEKDMRAFLLARRVSKYRSTLEKINDQVCKAREQLDEIVYRTNFIS